MRNCFEPGNVGRIRVGGWIVVTLLLLAWFTWFRPPMLGGETAYIMVSGQSMEPAMASGDLALVRDQEAYEVGDIVAFRGSGSVVIHRIIGGDAEDGFRLQGDNRTGIDPWRPGNDEIIGKHWFHVPYAGHFFAFLQQPLVLALFAGAVTLGMVSFGKDRIPWRKKKQARRRGRSPGPGEFGPPPAPPWRPAMFTRRTAIIAGVAGAAIFTTASVAVFVASAPGDEPVGPEDYEHRIAFSYQAETAESVVYPEGQLAVDADTPETERQAIFTELVDEIDVGIDYELATDLETDLAGVLTAVLELRAPGTWTHDLPVRPGSPFEGDATTESVTIDLEQIDDIIARFEDETGFSTNTYELVVRTEVGIAGAMGDERFEETFDADFPLTHGPTLIRAEEELVHSTNGIAPGHENMEEVQEASLFDFSGGDPVRVSSAIGTILGLMATGALVALMLRDQRALAGREVRSVNGERVLQVTGRYAANGTQRIVVATLDDLAAVAQREGEPVFHQRMDEGDIYFVPAGTVTYELRMAGREPRMKGQAQNGGAK